MNRIDPKTEEHHIRKEYLDSLKTSAKHAVADDDEEEEDTATSKKVKLADEKPAVPAVCPDEAPTVPVAAE